MSALQRHVGITGNNDGPTDDAGPEESGNDGALSPPEADDLSSEAGTILQTDSSDNAEPQQPEVIEVAQAAPNKLRRVKGKQAVQVALHRQAQLPMHSQHTKVRNIATLDAPLLSMDKLAMQTTPRGVEAFESGWDVGGVNRKNQRPDQFPGRIDLALDR